MIVTRLENCFLGLKYWPSLIYPVLFGLSSAAISLMPSSLSVIRLIFGIFGYIWLPGMLIAGLSLFESRNLGLSLVLGFLLQLLNVFVAWIFYMVFTVVNFLMMITILTLISVVILSLLLSNHACLHKKGRNPFALISPKNVDKYLLLSIFVYLALAMYFQQFAIEPHSDGASYLDLARNVVEKGIFRSNMLAPPNDWSNVIYTTGASSHIFGYFAFALFFTFGGVSLFSAKIGLIFCGFLIILITFLLTEELLGKNTARLSSLIVGTSALFLTQVGLVGGPEIISALFTLLTLYLVLIGTKSNKRVLLFLAGLSSFVVFYAWYLNFYALLGVLIFSTVFFATTKKEPIKTNLLISTLLFAVIMMDDRITSVFTLEKIGFPLPVLSIVTIPLVYFVSNRKNLKLPQLTLTIVSTWIVLDFAFSSLLLTSPQSQAFQNSLNVGTFQANAARDVGILSHVFNFNGIALYWNAFIDGAYKYIGATTFLLVLISFVEFRKIKKILFLAMFPIIQLLIWVLLVRVDGLQPRYLICVSLFYDILVASAILFLAESAIYHIQFNKIFSLKLKRTQLKIDVRKLLGLLVVILVFGFYIGLTLETYYTGQTVEQSWNYRQRFGWNDAISWIQNNTSSKDRLACTYGDYFAWYTNRQTLFLWSFPDMNESVLTNLIKTSRVNYLVVEKSFKSLSPELSGLYDSPHPFLGSTIDFMSQNEAGDKVIIYNVTNIAYGNLVSTTLKVEWKTLRCWTPLSYYSNGSVSVSQDAIELSLTVKETPWPSAAGLFTFPSSIDISQFSTLEFWVKPPAGRPGTFIIYSKSPSGQSYFTYLIPKVPSEEWVKVVIDLNAFNSVEGHPNLQNVESLGFVFGSFKVGDNASLWIRDLMLSRQEYVQK